MVISGAPKAEPKGLQYRSMDGLGVEGASECIRKEGGREGRGGEGTGRQAGSE